MQCHTFCVELMIAVACSLLYFKSLGSVQVFERTILCSPRMELFDQKYSKNSEILLQFKITVFSLNIF